MNKDFKTTTYGKWILSGEHSVLRGQEAIVVPLFSKSLNFEFIAGTDNSKKLAIEIHGKNSMDIESIVRALLSKATEILEIKNLEITGIIKINNDIPLGSGLGASSSLCVAFGRWFCAMNLIPEDKVYEFSRKLENLFHGESSGVDIAVVLNEKPLIFKRPQYIEFVEDYFKPNLYLSYSGQRGVTKDCVEKVKSLFESNPEKAARLDSWMQETTELLKSSIILTKSSSVELTPEERISRIILGFAKSYTIFQEWGLTRGAIEDHIQKLKDLGAIAFKPTGSGGGGYVLSLWPEGVTPKHSEIEFISIK